MAITSTDSFSSMMSKSLDSPILTIAIIAIDTERLVSY